MARTTPIDLTRDAWVRLKRRGTLCEEWLSFERFREEAGEKLPWHTLSRKDTSRPHSADNSFWEHKSDAVSYRVRTHGQASPGRQSPAYWVWRSAKKRCHLASDVSYPGYGGRGIVMCEEWRNSFETFYRDMGDKPDGMMLERIDNDGPYSPDNCRWATPLEQALNRRNTIRVATENGDVSLFHYCRIVGAKYSTVRRKVSEHGISPEIAAQQAIELHGLV